MPPLPLNSLFTKELVNVPVKLLYSRQELLRKIIANAAKRKTQLHIAATGDRMATTPQAFQSGKQIFDSLNKKAAFPLKTLQTGASKALSGILSKLRSATSGAKALTQNSPVASPVLTAAEEAAERYVGMPPQSGPARELYRAMRDTKRPMPHISGPSATEIEQAIIERAERAAGMPAQIVKRSGLFVDQSENRHKPYKQSNVLASPVTKSVLNKLLSSARAGGRRYVELLRGTKAQALGRKHEQLMDMLRDYPNAQLTRNFGDVADNVAENANYMAKQLQHQGLEEVAKVMGTRVSTTGAGLLGGAGIVTGLGNSMGNSKQSAASPILNGLDIKGPSAAERMLFKVWHPTHKFLFNMLRDHSKPIVGGIQKMPQKPAPLAKQSAALPEPTSRGQTKKVTLPEASPQQPDLDPEGVQMTEHDHNIHKEARFGSLLKLLAKGVYKTPRSLKALTVGGGGGYVAGRQHGHQVGLEDGREDAAKTLTDLFQKKQAFMGVGALAGMATAPNKEEEDLSIGRGALRGVGTGLGVGTGMLTGGALGGLGGAGLGAILGALSRGKYQPLGDAVSNGVAGGTGMGMLAGGLAGGAYGGYKGNKATKALLDKTAPISDKKKDKKDDDDKDVKEAAAAVLAQVQKHAADTPTPRAYSSVSTGQTQGGAPPGAYSGKVSVPVDSRPQNPIPRMPFAGRLPDVTLDEAETVNRYAGNPSIRAGYPTEQNFVPNRILVPAPAVTGDPSRKDVATAARQVARTAASPAASPHSPSRVEAQFGSPEFMRLRKKFR